MYLYCNILKPLTHTAEHGQGVRRGAAGPGRDFGWLESHLHRPQSNSATVERDMLSLLFVLFKLQFQLHNCYRFSFKI